MIGIGQESGHPMSEPDVQLVPALVATPDALHKPLGLALVCRLAGRITNAGELFHLFRRHGLAERFGLGDFPVASSSLTHFLHPILLLTHRLGNDRGQEGQLFVGGSHTIKTAVVPNCEQHDVGMARPIT